MKTHAVHTVEERSIWNTSGSTLLSKTLVEWGFKLNDYDPCVANKIINRKQCTIIWHVDDLKFITDQKESCGGFYQGDDTQESTRTSR